MGHSGASVSSGMFTLISRRPGWCVMRGRVMWEWKLKSIDMKSPKIDAGCAKSRRKHSTHCMWKGLRRARSLRPVGSDVAG